ncbi:MAG: hypothetical protein IJ060_13165, partial [Oscillospiraceae bacterium]|nr:hypothetical protein [Oscillospiraceae bacterium]
RPRVRDLPHDFDNSFAHGMISFAFWLYHTIFPAFCIPLFFVSDCRGAELAVQMRSQIFRQIV